MGPNPRHSALATDECDITLQHVAGGGGGIKIRLTQWQWSTVLEAPGGRRYLYTGASGPTAGVTEYWHSFTLVQEINTN